MNSIAHARKGRTRDWKCVAVTHTDLCKVGIVQWEDARCEDYINTHAFHTSHLQIVTSGTKP